MMHAHTNIKLFIQLYIEGVQWKAKPRRMEIYTALHFLILYRSFATTVSQLKMCYFAGEKFKGFGVL